jgi:hypothetical protein
LSAKEGVVRPTGAKVIGNREATEQPQNANARQTGNNTQIDAIMSTIEVVN